MNRLTCQFSGICTNFKKDANKKEYEVELFHDPSNKHITLLVMRLEDGCCMIDSVLYNFFGTVEEIKAGIVGINI